MRATPEFVTPGWCLRFLGGAMKGRTIALKPGLNQVGSSGDCDVMLPGADILPRHLVFAVGELVVSVQKAGAGAVLLNHEELAQARRSLVAGDVVSIGQIELQLERSYPAADRPDPMFAGLEPAAPGEPAQAETPAWRGTGFLAGAALLVLASAGLLGVALRAGSGGGPAASESLNPIAVARVLQPFGEVEAVAVPGGQLVVKGFVESGLRRQALEQAVQPFGAQVGVSVYAVDELVEQARRYVGDSGLAISYSGKGRLVVSGASDDEALRQKVRRLAEDMHPSVLVSDKVSWRHVPGSAQAADLRTQWDQWQQALPSRLVGITEDQDGLRSIELANGTRYYEGAPLKSGARIAHIDADGLQLEGAASAPR